MLPKHATSITPANTAIHINTDTNQSRMLAVGGIQPCHINAWAHERRVISLWDAASMAVPMTYGFYGICKKQVYPLYYGWIIVKITKNNAIYLITRI